ncbi:hypothetical protein E2I00_016543, partial [Balaenoptera physalus]
GEVEAWRKGSGPEVGREPVEGTAAQPHLRPEACARGAPGPQRLGSTLATLALPPCSVSPGIGRPRHRRLWWKLTGLAGCRGAGVAVAQVECDPPPGTAARTGLAPARPGLAQRKVTPPAAWGQEQGHNNGAGAVQSHLQATAAVGPGAARPRAAELRPLQATRTPRAQEGAVAAKEGQGRQAGGQEARKRGPKPRRPPKGEDQLGQAAPRWALQGVKWPRQAPASTNHTNTPPRSQCAQAERPRVWASGEPSQGRSPSPASGPRFGPFALGAKGRRPSGLLFQLSWPSHRQAQGAPGKPLPLGGPLFLCDQAGASSLILQGPPSNPALEAGVKRKITTEAKTTGRGRERPGSRHGLADPGAMEQAMPSLPASCLLAQAAIACGSVKMKHVPALSDPGLTTLYLAENEVAKIPAHAFLGLPNLEWLDLSKNKLDALGLHPHAFKSLTWLKRLNLDGNLLSTVPALPASLQELKLNDNLLQGLQRSSFRGLSQLLTLEVEGNRLHDGNISPLAFQPLRSLLYLRLDRNRLRTIPPGLPASLQELHLGTNVIEEVTEDTLNRSRSLGLEALDLLYNRLVHVPSFLPRGLRRLTLHHNRIERIPGYVFAHMKPGLEVLHLSHDSL